MLNVLIVFPEDGKRSTLDVTPRMEELHALQEEGMNEIQSPTTGEPKMGKLSARDLLTTLSRMRISTSEIEFIGNGHQAAGTYANVAVATFVKADGERTEGRRVAVKMFRFIMTDDMTEEKFLRVFVNELRLMDQLSHSNIAKIIGFVEDVEKSIAWLVSPWEDNGNLREFLRSGTWEIPERVSLIVDVALGLEYLHTRQPPVCHGDLKSLNILVNSSNRAVLTDFGSARILRQIQEPNADPVAPFASSEEDALPKRNESPQFTVMASRTALTLTGPACSLRWAPPEVLNGGVPDLAGDIWALGWIAWEALTDDYPFEELKLDFEVTMRIIEGRLPSLSGHNQLSQIRSLCSLMQSCWKSEPEERPSATECHRNLKWIPHVIPMAKGAEESKLRSAVLLQRMGTMLYTQKRYQEASTIFEEGLAIARSTEDQARVAYFLVHLAHNQRAQSKYVDAEASLNEALNIFKRIGDDVGRATALSALGYIQRALFKPAEAEASVMDALAIYEKAESRADRANASFCAGEVHWSLPRTVETDASFAQAVVMYESLGDERGRANALCTVGRIHQARSQYVEAEVVYTRALSVYENIGYERGRVYVTIDLSELRLHQGRYTEAKALINDATAISNRTNYSSGIRKSKKLLEQILEAERRSVKP